MTKLRIATLWRDPEPFPARWVGRTDSGNWVFLQYRFGRIGIAIAPTQRRVRQRLGNVCTRVVGELTDSDLTYRRLKALPALAAFVAVWPEALRTPPTDEELRLED